MSRLYASSVMGQAAKAGGTQYFVTTGASRAPARTMLNADLINVLFIFASSK